VSFREYDIDTDWGDWIEVTHKRCGKSTKDRAPFNAAKLVVFMFEHECIQ
jgi:hypothetical protein